MIVRSVKEVQSFTLSDIKANLISYVHDDSENDFDFFGFTIEAMDPKGYSRLECSFPILFYFQQVNVSHQISDQCDGLDDGNFRYFRNIHNSEE